MEKKIEDFASELIGEIIHEVCVFADVHTLNRDKVLEYISLMLDGFVELTTIRDYELEDTP